MKTTITRIEKIIETEKQATAKQLLETLNVSQVLIHRHLKILCERGVIRKIGKAPKVYYIYSKSEEKIKDESSHKVIEDNWLEVDPNGDFIYGNRGFSYWCKKRNHDSVKQRKVFEKMWFEKELFKKNGLIDATKKITDSFEVNYLEKLWYIDFYSWEIFGKTLLGKLILYAKQNSDLVLMEKIATRIEEPIQELINIENFDMVGMIPHSIARKRDFLKTTLKFTNFTITPQHVFDKVFVGHSVAQKTLKSKDERERNARETLFLNKQTFPKKILLIDDACGSGATMNISAQKIKNISPNTKIYGLTLVGSIKGFDIIAET